MFYEGKVLGFLFFVCFFPTTGHLWKVPKIYEIGPFLHKSSFSVLISLLFLSRCLNKC